VSAARRPAVAMVTDAIHPFHHGGKELRYHELARRLAESAEVDVYTMKWWPGPAVRREGGVTYRAICPMLPLYRGGRRSIAQALVFALCCTRLAFRRFDAIEADHMPYMHLLPLRIVATLRRKRFVVTWHEVWGPAYWRRYLGRAGRAGWWLERLAMRLPDAVVAASAETAERLAPHLRDGVPVVVAPNGVDLEAIATAPADAPHRDVIAVGRLLDHKRIDLLLDALALLRDRGEAVSCRIVGNGPGAAELHERARALGIDDAVDFRHDVATREELYGLLKSASVFAFPSEREGFGIAALEAMASGLPVVTTSAPDNLAQHLVARSPRGVVCEPTADALAAAIDGVLARAENGAAASDGWIGEYRWEAVADRVAGAVLR
jgi:glycosyltransferase involved in cell wall biosynthesis